MVLDKNLMNDIINVIDTGACRQYIIDSLPEYKPTEIRLGLNEMIELGLLEYRPGRLLVFMHKHPLAKEIYNA